MKFSVYNLGCKVNSYECESVAKALEEKGFTRVSFEEEADIAIIFTCAVTNMASQKSRKMLHRIKREYPREAVCMVGCYSQLNDGKIDDADIIVGTAHKKDIPSYVETYFQDRKPIRIIESLDNIQFENLTTNEFENKSRAYLKIQDGCNQFCTYCVIPYLRGKERSMDIDQVVLEAKSIAQNYPEIVLTGIHTGRYGYDKGYSLYDVIVRILNETTIHRIRISSIEITEINDALIELIAKEDRIAKHLHIPLQAGADETLKRMQRPYSTNAYYDIIQKIRNRIPDISISCDLIVGFPMESDELFQASYDFVKKCEFSFLHVFPFSSRNGTKAAEMKQQVDAQTKKARVRACTNLSKELLDSYQKEWIGKKVEVIAERNDGEFTYGYSSNYMLIKTEGVIENKEYFIAEIVGYDNHQLVAKRL